MRERGAELELLDELLAGQDEVAVRLADGTTCGPAPGARPRATLVLRRRGSLRALLWPPTQLAMAEAYVHGEVDVEGDIHAVFRLADRLLVGRGLADRARLAARILRLPRGERGGGRRPGRPRGRRGSLARDCEAVTYHYDLSNEFFAAYLDRRMVYTCAYFRSPEDDLDTAQEQKLDHLCRKLRLRPGERLLDVGCGWGGLVMWAAERYGVEALGITLSEPQAELANERIRAAGLERRCRVEVVDYRELRPAEPFDKVVSVCMFEAVAEEDLPAFFARCRALLRPGGVFLNQGIASNWHFDRTARRGPSFIERYVFPDGGLVPVSTALRAAELGGLEVRDVESLREHYELTLRHWVARLEEHREEAVSAVDETAYRIWRLYMAGSAYGMRTGRLNVYQALFASPASGRSGLPLTREDWYAREPVPEPALL